MRKDISCQFWHCQSPKFNDREIIKMIQSHFVKKCFSKSAGDFATVASTALIPQHRGFMWQNLSRTVHVLDLDWLTVPLTPVRDTLGGHSEGVGVVFSKGWPALFRAPNDAQFAHLWCIRTGIHPPSSLSCAWNWPSKSASERCVYFLKFRIM